MGEDCLEAGTAVATPVRKRMLSSSQLDMLIQMQPHLFGMALHGSHIEISELLIMIIASINYILTHSAYPRSFERVHVNMFCFMWVLLPRSASNATTLVWNSFAWVAYRHFRVINSDYSDYKLYINTVSLSQEFQRGSWQCFLFHVGILLPRSAALEKSAVPTAAGTPDFMIAQSKTHINQHFDSSNVDDDAT